jgi:molybdopterin-biosynthesis enzyme MoeA-like protein
MHAIDAGLPEGQYATPLADIAKAHETLSIGSYPSYVDGAFRNQIIVRGREPQQVSAAAEEIEAMLAKLRAGLKG